MLKPKSVDDYIFSIPKWSVHLEKLRTIILNAGLKETIKWAFPVYTYKNKNLISLGGFKNHVAVWFFYGSFLVDENSVLIHGETAKTMKQMRFLTLKDINKEQIHNFIQQSILLIDDGVKIPRVVKGKLVIPVELQNSLDKEGLLANFDNFTMYKKREFCNYISSAKRESTLQNRLKKIIPLIKINVGINDKYRNC